MGRTAGTTRLSNAPATSGASCVCHAPSQLPRALQPGGDVCPAPKVTLVFPFLLGRGRHLDPKARDIGSGDAGTPEYEKGKPTGPIDRKLLELYRTWTDEELLAVMLKDLRDYAGDEGARAVVWFTKANGAKYPHPADSTLSKMAQETRQFVTSYHTVVLRIREAVRKLAAGGRVPEFAALSVAVPPTSWGLLDVPTGAKEVASNELALKAIFGGTQGEEIWVTALKHNRLQRLYALHLRWVILDHFGVDEHDLYAKSLYAFYVLQHERQGYRAYVNELVIERWMAGTY
ncbi:MAG: hypothetical protein U0529_10285 [Thermoanaerobaculia bacterium]